MSKVDRIGGLFDEYLVCFEIHASHIELYNYTFDVSQNYFGVPKSSGLVLPLELDFLSMNIP